MADNVVANPGSGGSTFRTYNDAGGIEHPASVVEYVSGGSAGAWALQQVDATHGLPVSVLGTVPVSGTVTANQGGAPWTSSIVAGGNTATVSAAGALKVDGSGTTQPVSGTVTANQGGTWSVTVTDSVPLSVVLTAASVIAGEFKLIDSAGVNVATVSAAGAVKVDGSGVTQPVSGTVTANQGGAPWAANITQIAGAAIALGQAAMVASLPVAIASNQTAIPVSQSGTWNVASIQNALPAGANTIGGVNQAGTWNVNATPQAGTSGGATPYHLVSAATTNATNVKGSAGVVYGVQGFTTNGSPRYLKLFDKATAPVLGTDTPVKTFLIPGNTSGAGVVYHFPVGISFAAGISFAITGGMADTDPTAVTAGDCVIGIDYK